MKHTRYRTVALLGVTGLATTLLSGGFGILAASSSSDLDCGDFPLLDGRTAQQVLDADQSDPHRLDADDDGLACEGSTSSGATTATPPAAETVASTTPTPTPTMDPAGAPSVDALAEVATGTGDASAVSAPAGPPAETASVAPVEPARAAALVSDDLDCTDFPLPDGTTAQEVLDRDRRDPHRLDRDGDGLACEGSSPTSTSAVTAAPVATAAPVVAAAPVLAAIVGDLDCPDFPLPDGTTAQQVLDADRSDPNRLDRDRDGRACESASDDADRADLIALAAGGRSNALALTGADGVFLLGTAGAGLLALGLSAVLLAGRLEPAASPRASARHRGRR